MRLFYCVKCCNKTRARNDVYILICDCGYTLVEKGIVQPCTRELPLTKRGIERKKTAKI